MRAFDAVLFDWSGTLVHDPLPDDRLRRALETLRRDTRSEVIDELSTALDAARDLPEVAEALRDEDTSAERHRSSNRLWFERAGLDAQLIETLYNFDDEIENRPLYLDAQETLAALRGLGVRIAVVSDIHIDLRPIMETHGVGALIDEYVLSFEHGCQKPDPRMFVTTLELLDVPAERALMVGDRFTHDGGAAAVGITTLILPPPPPVNGVRGLTVVPRMVAGG